MISIAKPLIGEEEVGAIREVIASGQLAAGPKVREFEARFAELCGTEYAIATSSGTAALHVSMLAHQIGPSDEVITSPFSFISSSDCVLFAGARPVFVDIEPEFFTIDPAKIEERITPHTKAIIPIHLYGQLCDMDAIVAIARKHNLAIIEDACQAHGATYKGQPAGSFGTGCFSFYATKNMTTIEGGMIVTNDPQIAERARLFRNHGSPRTYEHVVLGYNLMTTDLSASIGLVQLTRLKERNAMRQANAEYLTSRLSSIKSIVTPKIRKDSSHIFHQYTIRITDRDAAVQKLREKGVGTGIYYPTPIHQQPSYKKLGYTDSLPISEAASREVVSLPIHPSVTRDDLDYIARCISEL